MPFNPVASPMPPNPPIRIFFHGLIVLHSPAGSIWFAEIHREASTHTLSIEVRMKEAGLPDQILFRHHGNLNGRDPGLRITTARADGTPDPSPVVANKYIPSGASFPVANPAGEHRKDFRWVLNLEHGQFHNADLKVKTAKTRPAIEVAGGRSFLHTALFKNGPIGLTQGSTAKPDLLGIAGIVGANLYLEDGTMAVLDFDGRPPVTLPKPPADSPLSYEIYVENSPLHATSDHDEMAEYYKAVEEEDGDDIDPPQQFKLQFPRALASLTGSAKFTIEGFRASIRIPCMPTTLDGQ